MMNSIPALADDEAIPRRGASHAHRSDTTTEALNVETTAAAVARGRETRPMVSLLGHVESDVIAVHTREAYWMFTGRSADRGRRRIQGGQRAAAVLNELRHISVAGNPYADWFLVQFEQQVDSLRGDLAKLVRAYRKEIDQLRCKGLTLHILGARTPLQVNVAFGSAYGYAVAETIVEFDEFVRILKTLVLKNRLTAEAGRVELRRVGRPLRRLFVRVLLWERALRSSPWRDVRRRDYLDFSDGPARARVSAAIERFGPLPEAILSMALLPRHFARRTGGLGDDVLTLTRAAGATAHSAEDALI